MVRPDFVAVADLHFDEHGPWKYKGIVGDAEYGLTQVVDYCLENQAAQLVLLGDLVDRPTPRQQAVLEICEQVDRLAGAEIPARYVLGDHDGRQDWPGLHHWPDNVDQARFAVGPAIGYGLGYRPRARLQEALAAIPGEASILFTHQKWEDFVSKSGHARLDEVPGHVRYVLTGDYHEKVWGEFGAGQLVWSPGSTHPTSVAEDSPRHFLAGWVGRDGLRCEFVPLKSRPVFRVRVSGPDDLARLVGVDIDEMLASAGSRGLPPHISRPIVEVAYYTDVPHAYEQIAALGDRCHVFARPKDRERQRRRDAVATARPALTIEEAVGRLAKPGTPGHDWTLRLLDAKDRRAEWRAIVEEESSR